MKVETAELPDSEVALSLEIEDARLERAMDAAYRRAAGRVNIAGFRRGKAPRVLVERVVGRESLLEDALGQLLPEVFSEAVKETQIHPVTEPEFDVESLTPLRAKATVIVEPAVTLGDYRSISKETTEVEVDPADVDAALEQMRQRYVHWVPVERPSQMGDLVTLTATGSAGERVVFQREEAPYLLDAQSEGPLPGFADQLAGAAAGDGRTFELTVPSAEDWGTLAGETVAFEAAILDVKEKELPDLDDELAESAGYTDLSDMRSSIEERIRSSSENAARMAVQQAVLEDALLFCTVKVPQKLIDQQTARSYDRLASDLDSRGLTIEQYLQARSMTDEAIRAELTTDAERTLKRRFVLRRIAEAEDVTVGDEEIDAELAMLQSIDTPSSRAAWASLRTERGRENLRGSMLEDKAVKWLVANATGPSPEPAESEPGEEQ